MSIFEKWGVRPIINASGAVTRLGGAPMPASVLDAFSAAAIESVPLDELQGAASRVIAAATGAEAGIVTAGAAAGLTLGAAAILAGFDLSRIERLPHCDGFPNEFVVAREQRNGYDHAVRAAGAKLIELGFHEIIAGAGVRRAEAWEFEAAFGPMTAGVLYVYDRNARPPLDEVVARAHAHGLPVLVDAAGELPPRSNLHGIVATAADLVVFSGGKALRGPQASGILCGRRDLPRDRKVVLLRRSAKAAARVIAQNTHDCCSLRMASAAFCTRFISTPFSGLRWSLPFRIIEPILGALRVNHSVPGLKMNGFDQPGIGGGVDGDQVHFDLLAELGEQREGGQERQPQQGEEAAHGQFSFRVTNCLRNACCCFTSSRREFMRRMRFSLD